MHQLTPAFILHQHAAGRQRGRFPAAALFLDISGFTAVTEALMAHGKAGSEVLADVMQAIFTPLIAAVAARGGFITGFAGDAFTAVFPGHGVAAKARALDAAWTLRTLLADRPDVETLYGRYTFTGKIGVAYGPVNWGILGDDVGRTYYFRGAAIDACAAAEHLAAGGNVVVAARLAAALSPYLVVEPIPATDYVRLLGVTGEMPVGRPLPEKPIPPNVAEFFQPAALLHTTIRGEFRQVVSVFVNLQGSPRPAVLAEFMGHCQRLLRQYGGYLCRLDFGDKGCNLLLFWGAPASHENDIDRALNFLLDLQAAVALPLRAGVTYRQVFAGFAGSAQREEYTCYGLSVNQAARQMMAAAWGQVWLDGETARRALPRFHLELVGERPFKGFARPQPVFVLRRRRDTAESYYRSQFVGREQELAHLVAQWQPLENGRFGGVVVVSGEAGMGKSRLVYEALVGLPADWRVVLCQTDEILRRPFNPFRFWLHRYFEQSGTQSPAANKAAFERKMAALSATISDTENLAELRRTASFLGALVGLYWPDSLYEQLEPELRRENTLLGLKTLLRAEARQQPVIVVVEDAQWLDEASQAMLQRLPRNMDALPLALVLTSRDATVVDLFDTAVTPTMINMTGLSEAATIRMATAQLGRPPAPALVALLQARAEGNPFFLEQILLYLREQGALRETAVGWTVAAAETALPDDVQALLVARLDQLTQAVREVVQTAAVLGREFEVLVLAQMLRHQSSLTEHISQAEEAAVWSAFTELTYLFRHALLRDAAYQMQLQARLRTLHRSAATALEQLYAAHLEAHAEAIGYHFAQAGDVDAAVPYWRQAADAAQRNYQNEQALALLEQVLAVADRLQSTEVIALRQQQADILSFTGQFEAAEAALLAALALAEEETAVATATVLTSLGKLYHQHGEFAQADKALQRSHSLLMSLNEPALLAITYRELGNTQDGFGNYDRATAYYRQYMAICQSQGDVWGQAQANLNLGLMLWNKGEFDNAEALYLQALTGFQETADIYSQGKVYNNLGSVAWGRQDMIAARAYYEQAYTILRDCGSYLGQSITLGNLGSVNFYLKDFPQALTYHLQSLQISQEANDSYGVAYSWRNLADTYQMLGQREEAVTLLRQAISLALQIQADALVLDSMITAADVVRHRDGEQAYLLLAFVKAHPACYEDMAWRLGLVMEKLEGVTAVARARIDDTLSAWTLPEIARHILNNLLPPDDPLLLSGQP